MATPALIRKIAEFIESDGLFARDTRIVIGVSGGADSMALLHALIGLNRDHGYNLQLHIAHLNHMLRGEDSDADAAFVEAAADAHDLPRTVERRDITALSGDGKGSMEEVARRERYALFERVCFAAGAKHIALGHHADDNAETVLHRIIRGSGLRGIAGVAPSRTLHWDSEIRVVRPLLPFSRKEIRRYLADEGITYRDDASNAATETTRNKIRNVLLPQLERDFNPQVREALRRLSEQARWTEEYIRETAFKTFATLIISRTDQELVLNAQALARKSRIVQTELVRSAIATFEVGEQDLTFGHLKKIIDLIGEPGSGKQITLPGGMTARLVYSRMILSRLTDEPRETLSPQVAIHVPGVSVLPMRRMELTCDTKRLTAEEVSDRQRSHDRLEEWLDLDNVHLPLFVRGRQPGDRFWPLGAPGSKKLSDFLIDAKVDPVERDHVAVLCDQLGPIWIVGHRIDERVKMTCITREALRVRVRNLNG